MEADNGDEDRKSREGKTTEQHLMHLGKPALLERIRKLETHVQQLQNLLQAKDKPQTARPVRPFDFSRFKRRHVALRLLYLGWDYSGYVLQEDTGRTVEVALFEALERTRLLEDRTEAHYHRCGRTDKGVSAFSQVISIDLRTNLTEGVGVFAQEGYQPNTSAAARTEELDYVKILNGVLPPEIRVLAWAPVDQAFSARFDCRQRTYRYFFPRGSLDVQRMQEAAALLVGEHDFRNLCKMDVANGVTNYMRRILHTRIFRWPPPRPLPTASPTVSPTVLPTGEDGSCTAASHGDGFTEDSYDLLCLEIVGQAFLWHQVRCIVAVLLLVGQRLEEPHVISELLDVAKNPRKPQYAMAAELPLVLYDCQFEGLEWQQSAAEAEAVATHLQALWTQARIKSALLESILSTLPDVQSQPRCLLPRIARSHKPLLERPLCGSLEERMASHAKRRKICTDDQEDMVE
ncbi:tRNA pseudouridine(38/39) synthase isoform X3 [Dermacentor andersoni]|uniref:tRNA pseudouridine(38/39) synthase isoform X3 n=1 Tax=Dermacentor andersoni TaxID=34620 RepID=UPI0024180F90|nr:tRNA pseudouridine(38/39) synthase-like isoform X3 [Dermacentor andersoni]